MTWAAVLLLPEWAAAQAPHVEITDIRIGYPGSINRTSSRGTKPMRFKVGAWAPVYVDLEVRDAPLEETKYLLMVETTDGDDMQNVYVEKHFLPTIDPKQPETLLAYVRIGSMLQRNQRQGGGGHADSIPIASCATASRSRKSTSIRCRRYIYGYLTLGGRARAPSLYQALVPSAGTEAGPSRNGGPPNEPPGPARRTATASLPISIKCGRCRPTGSAIRPVDTAILLTSNKQFVNELTRSRQGDPVAARREASGGVGAAWRHLIVSVTAKPCRKSTNAPADEAHRPEDRRAHKRSRVAAGRRELGRAAGDFRGLVPKNKADAAPSMEIARFKPGRGVQVLA